MTGEIAATPGHHAATLAGAIVNTLRMPLLVLNGDLRVIAASPVFCQTFKASPEQTIDCLLFDLGNGQWDIPALHGFLSVLEPRAPSDLTIGPASAA